MDVSEIQLVVSNYLADGVETQGQRNFISVSRDYQDELETFADSIEIGLEELVDKNSYKKFSRYYEKLLGEIKEAIEVVGDNIATVENGGIPKDKFVKCNADRRVFVLMTLRALFRILVKEIYGEDDQ